MILNQGDCVKVHLDKGSKLKIRSIDGGQAVDINFNGFSAPITIDVNKRLCLNIKDIIFDKKAKPILRVVDMSDVYVDIIFPGCSSCRESISKVLGIKSQDILSMINIFMNIEINDFGIDIVKSKSKPGDYIILEALDDVDIGVSVCTAKNCNLRQGRIEMIIRNNP